MTAKKGTKKPTKEVPATGIAEMLNIEQSETLFAAWLANMKRTYDLQQTVDNQVLAQVNTQIASLSTIQTNLLANMADNSNAQAKQSLLHNGVVLNKLLNLEPSEGAAEAVVMRSVTIDDASLKAIGSVVAAVNATLLE